MERITFNTVEAEKELEQMEDVLKTLRTFSTVVGASKGISSVIQTVLELFGDEWLTSQASNY